MCRQEAPQVAARRRTCSSSQSWPMAMPMRRSGMPCGQLKFTSNASTPASSHMVMRSSHALRSYSSMIEAMRILREHE